MKRISLHAPLAGAFFAAAMFGVSAAAEKDAAGDAAFAQALLADFAALENDRASCRPFGPRFLQRTQRYQLCMEQDRRMQLVKDALIKQARYESK